MSKLFGMPLLGAIRRKLRKENSEGNQSLVRFAESRAAVAPVVSGYGNTFADLGIATHYKYFAPRVGLAYRFQESTVVRAGFGISYTPNSDRMIFDRESAENHHAASSSAP